MTNHGSTAVGGYPGLVSTAQALRILVIMLAVTMSGVTVAITALYARSYRVNRREGPRFLPVHVATIAASFIILAALGAEEMVSRFEQPPTWRLPLLLVGFGLANVAQAIMLNVVLCQLQTRRGPDG